MATRQEQRTIDFIKSQGAKINTEILQLNEEKSVAQTRLTRIDARITALTAEKTDFDAQEAKIRA